MIYFTSTYTSDCVNKHRPLIRLTRKKKQQKQQIPRSLILCYLHLMFHLMYSRQIPIQLWKEKNPPPVLYLIIVRHFISLWHLQNFKLLPAWPNILHFFLVFAIPWIILEGFIFHVLILFALRFCPLFFFFSLYSSFCIRTSKYSNMHFCSVVLGIWSVCALCI